MWCLVRVEHESWMALKTRLHFRDCFLKGGGGFCRLNLQVLLCRCQGTFVFVDFSRLLLYGCIQGKCGAYAFLQTGLVAMRMVWAEIGSCTSAHVFSHLALCYAERVIHGCNEQVSK